MKIEQKVADTILQNSLGSIVVEDHEYQIAPPTTGTLILISALISELPELDADPESIEFVGAVLKAAGEGLVLGKIAATLILGAKRIKERPLTTIPSVEYKKKWSWRKFRKIDIPTEKAIPVYERDYLAEKILDIMTAQELHDFISKILSEAHLADFFVLTTSLSAKSITTPTKEVGTIASGLPSEAGPNIGK